MMKTITFLLLACLSALSSRAEPLDYDTSVIFVQERSEEKVPKERAIFCLGPQQVEEVYNNNGKEDKKIARLARSYDFETAKTVGRLLFQASVEDGVFYDVSIYRSDKKELLVRITGVGYELHNSQFPLKIGDLLVIQPVVREK